MNDEAPLYLHRLGAKDIDYVTKKTASRLVHHIPDNGSARPQTIHELYFPANRKHALIV